MIVLTVVAMSVMALALSTTPAIGDGTWTGLGDGTNWSDMANWQNADTSWKSGDPRAGGNWILNDPDAATKTTVCDVHTLNDWGQGRADRLYLGEDSVLYVPTGSYLERERFITGAGAEIYVNGGVFKPDSRASGFYMEVSGGGEWSCARWTYSGGGTLHIVGSDVAQVTMGDFMSWSANSTPTVQFTLDGDGVTPYTFGNVYMGHGPGAHGSVTIEVDGIEAYLAGNGNVGDVIPLLYDTSGPIDYPDITLYPPETVFTTGLVADGLGSISMMADGSGFELTILAAPTTTTAMVLIVK